MDRHRGSILVSLTPRLPDEVRDQIRVVLRFAGVDLGLVAVLFNSTLTHKQGHKSGNDEVASDHSASGSNLVADVNSYISQHALLGS